MAVNKKTSSIKVIAFLVVGILVVGGVVLAGNKMFREGGKDLGRLDTVKTGIVLKGYSARVYGGR